MLMGRQLDAGSAEILKEIAAKHVCGDPDRGDVAAIEGEGHVSGIRIDGGETIPADIVIVSAGVRAKTDLAQEMGPDEIGRAVKVDSHMATNLPDIYACGDCAEYEGMNYAIWPGSLPSRGASPEPMRRANPLEYEPVEAALTLPRHEQRLFSRRGTTARIRISCTRPWSSATWAKNSTGSISSSITAFPCDPYRGSWQDAGARRSA